MARRGYGPYRGHSGLRKFLKTLIVALAIVLVLTVGVLIYLQQYIVYSADGARLELPFFTRVTPPPTPTSSAPLPSPTLPLVVVTPEVVGPACLHAAFLPRAALYDGTADRQLTDKGASAAVFDMKGDDGTLAFVSNVPLAIAAKASSGDPAINAAIRALNAEEGMYTVARVSCFKDHLLSNADRTLNITTNSGYRWTDPDGLRWSSPTSEKVRRYLADLCAELAALGFDEILLDNAGYPTEGNLGYIKKGANYDKAEFSAVMDGFFAQVAAALEEYPEVKLSVVTDAETVVAGTNALSGQTLQSLVEHAARIWLLPGESTGEALAAQAEAAGLKEPAQSLVLMGRVPGGTKESWAVLP